MTIATEQRAELGRLLERYMSERGLKSTRQRNLIIEVFFDMHGHLSVEEVWSRVRQDWPSAPLGRDETRFGRGRQSTTSSKSVGVEQVGRGSRKTSHGCWKDSKASFHQRPVEILNRHFGGRSRVRGTWRES